jgi:hypothetical protein
MIELQMENGYYLILSPNYEDYSTDVYLHRFGQVLRDTVKQNVKNASELETIIKMMKEKTNA